MSENNGDISCNIKSNITAVIIWTDQLTFTQHHNCEWTKRQRPGRLFTLTVGTVKQFGFQKMLKITEKPSRLTVAWQRATIITISRGHAYTKKRNCFLVCVSGLITAYIICCLVNVTLDTILGIEDILISWFLIILILVLLYAALLFVCCLIHCKHLRLSDVNKHTYLLTYKQVLSLICKRQSKESNK